MSPFCLRSRIFLAFAVSGLLTLEALICPRLTLAEPSVEESPVEAPLSVTVPPLPLPGQKEQLLIVSNLNWAGFQDVLLAPVAQWLRESKIAIRVVRRLDFAWRISPKYQHDAEQIVGRFELAPDMSLRLTGEPTPLSAPPFGSAEDIDREDDAAKRAYKILWNSTVAEGSARDMFYQVEMAWIGSHSLLRRANGIFYRRWMDIDPKSLVADAPPMAGSPEAASTPAPKQPQLYRQDILQFTSPPVVNGYAQFSWRYLGPEEDRTWIYSPVISRQREVLPANRSDGIIGGSLSPDDILVSSVKPQAVLAKVVDEKTLLVPFAGVNYYRLELDVPGDIPAVLTEGAAQPASAAGDVKKEDVAPKASLKADVPTAKGYYQRPDGSSTMVTWNYESRQLAQLAPWVPTSVTFVPRRVWIIEVDPIDPAYNSGHEVIIVDQESMLPVYKLVYDRAGEYRKTILGGWGQARSKDGDLRFPFVGFVLAVDQAAQLVTALNCEQVQTFLGKNSKAATAVQKLLTKDGHPDKKPKSDKDKPAKEGKVAPPKENGDDEAPGEVVDDEAEAAQAEHGGTADAPAADDIPND